MNQAPSAAEMEAAALVAVSSSPNSAVSSFQVDLSGAIAGSGGGGSRNDSGDADRACSRASDEEENGPTRKKLRLSKEQSAYLEESFREHNTLNPVSSTTQGPCPNPNPSPPVNSWPLFHVAEAEGSSGEAAQPPASAGGGLVSEQESQVLFFIPPRNWVTSGLIVEKRMRL